MHGLDVIKRKNQQAVAREFMDAIEQDDVDGAFRIVDALISDALAQGTPQADQQDAA